MKFIILVGFAVISLSVTEMYTDRFDNINIDEILQNKRLLSSYIKCILDQGRCTPEGKEVKVHLQDGMLNGCNKCTESQKQMARKVAKHLQDNELQFWEDVIKKFDPDNKYKATYEAFLASED